MEELTISIVIPVYNVERYLDRCIQSVVNQTYKKIEILLIDDGSTDRSGKKCDEWEKKDDRIKVIHKENGGLGSARNVGIKIATGDYIGFVDSDDWISGNMYANLLDLCINYSADISCCGIKYVTSEVELEDHGPERIHIYTREEYALKYFKISSNKTVHYAVNKLYRKDIGKRIHYPEGLIDEDVEGFIYALLHSENIVTTNRIMYYYWQNTDGISYKWFSEKQLDLLQIWDHVVRICRTEKPEWNDYAEINMKRAYFGLLFRLALNTEEEDDEFIEIEIDLVKNLKTYERKLLSSKMPMNRKLILFCMCRNYKITKKAIRLVKGIYHRTE